jgi:hypothetical protein
MRSVADKRSFGNPGNRMPSNSRSFRRGADPPKNESGMTVAVSNEKSARCLSTGKGFCIAIETSSKWGTRRRMMIIATRSLRSSTPMTLSNSSVFFIRPLIQRGRGGQTSSVSLAGVLATQKRCRLRRRGDPKTRLRHRRHTCTSDCHASILFFVY